MSKLAIVTAVHGRERITIAFLKAMSRIREEFGVQTYMVVTPDDENLLLIEELGFPYLTYKNKPLGEKWNAGVEALRVTDCTHMMILGSDDIPSSGMIKHSLTLMGEYDIMGVDGLWFWGLNPRRAGWERFGFFPVPKVIAGTGKVVSRRVLEACDYRPWPDNANYGMDAKMMQKCRSAMRQKKMAYKTHRYSLREAPNGFLMDVKCQHHISSMSPIIRRPGYVEQDPYLILPQHLPMDECTYLFDLYERTKEEWLAKKERKEKVG